MASMAEKLRARRAASKAGRPKKRDAERYPSGQIKKAWTEKEAKSVVIEARARIHGLSGTDKIAEAGYTAGRMWIDGSITKEELDAGNEYCGVVNRYYRAIGAPFPSARAQSLGRVKGFDGDEPLDMADKVRHATNRMMFIEGLLLQCGEGPQVKTTVHNLFIMDYEMMRFMHPTQLRWLKTGLDALKSHFNLSKSTERR